MKKRIALLAFLVLLGFAYWWLRAGPRRDQIPPTTIAAPDAPAGPVAELVRPDRDPNTEDRAAVESRPPVSPSQPSSALAHVKGRCVAAETGSPLAGCKVTFQGAPTNSGDMARYGEVHWTDPEPVITSENGRFDIAFEPPPPYQHFLDVLHKNRVPRTARWGAFAPGQVEDLGDIALSLGHFVEGHVVDASGSAVADVAVFVRGLPLPLHGDMAANDSRGGKSDASGAFRIDVPIPAGTWSLDARARGVKLVSPDTLTVPDTGSPPPVTVVVRSMPSISGVVVDEKGAGVPRVNLMAKLKRSGRMASARTADDGSFTIYAVDDDLAPVRIESHDTGPCEPMAEPAGPYAWGTTDVRIELVRALSFELTVVERLTGKPVEEFSVVCAPDRATWSHQGEDRLGGRHPGGSVTVDRVWHGTSRLTVHPRDPELFPNAPIVFEATNAPLPAMRVELERAVRRSVRVVDAAREPVAASRVELIRLGSEPLDAGSFVMDPKLSDSFSSTDDLDRPHELVADSTTDERGLATLPVPPGGEGLGVRVTGLHHLAAVLAPVRFPQGGGALELAVASGGRIAGTLRIEGYAPGVVFLELDRDDVGHDSPPPRFAVGADGSFETTSLGPGVWSIYVSLEHRFEAEGSSSGSSLRLEPALARTAVIEGRTLRIDLDGRDLAGGDVSATLSLDGAPLAECRAFLVRNEGAGGRFGQYVPDASGRFEAKGLPPGQWTAGVVVGDFKAREGDWIQSEESFVLAPGGSVRSAFAFQHRRLILHVLGPDGVTPLASAGIEVDQLARLGLFLDRSTDAQGRLVLDPAPSGEFRLRSAGLVSDLLRMPRDRKEAELDAVLRNP